MFPPLFSFSVLQQIDFIENLMKRIQRRRHTRKKKPAIYSIFRYADSVSCGILIFDTDFMRFN